MAIYTRNELRAMKAGIETLVDIHAEIRSTSNKPSDTAALLVDRLGKASAHEIVAIAVHLKGQFDGRISAANRRWADEIYPFADELDKQCLIYYPSEIHPAHLDMIADAMRKLNA
ncbi:MAG: DUF3849 domain-containing protein [Clostridia bacterium]|nr:DUF3849 domain-containing protein [Clostridia bacterium]